MNAFAHMKSREHKARRVKSLQEVVSHELDTPYPMQRLLDTGQVVLTLVDESGDGACPMAPSLWRWCGTCGLSTFRGPRRSTSLLI